MQRELITFQVSGQVFALDIMQIREIRAWSPVTPMPRVPSYVAGVVNLRGTVLPVVDLAARLGWPATEATPRHAIIVCQVNGQAQGLIVESVSDIVTFDSETLQAPPSTGNDSVVPFLEGLAAIDDNMVMVLDLQALSSAEDGLMAA
ncbi:MULTISPECIES: chemotaxis protein CheW [Novosphingobium]|jgi:purine-binding chemotaxis protein CheW|uniref:Purine-binding chemotaxis protein CheW n=1 Tax=Novosphingobium pentaromativorans US6-1 TaxID=1088721 RepID=G6E909_9SPHN|nr:MULTISPECIES: chemotaxis protein CheW [Novosphingobium]AIT81168.1 chemotaxis protein CheW [Novosphingobium pentaromativorans US6-1]EHJ62233.1 purine-binding chemotaxis protein CheW [Novosphingobium pentaromativorans US6-1]GFM30040.1 purine-binding chemotaxis protein CheW [Novosphingobium sp. PY1]CCA92688.1 purine-binding chemotaxis protein CheW [Novosphingobium sp. PP1Y]